jgi:hypothetical protein
MCFSSFVHKQHSLYVLTKLCNFHLFCLKSGLKLSNTQLITNKICLFALYVHKQPSLYVLNNLAKHVSYSTIKTLAKLSAAKFKKCYSPSQSCTSIIWQILSKKPSLT